MRLNQRDSARVENRGPLIDDDGATVVRGHPFRPRVAASSTSRRSASYGSASETCCGPSAKWS